LLRRTATSDKTNWDSAEHAFVEIVRKKESKAVSPDFFDDIMIGRDGGLGEINNEVRDKSDCPLWYTSRYFSSVLLLAFVVYNVYFIFKSDLRMIRYEKPSNSTPTLHPLDANLELDDVMDDYLLSHWFFTTLLPDFVTRRIQSPMIVIGYVELGMLVYFLGNLVWDIIQAFELVPSSTSSGGHKKWKAVSEIYWYDFPRLSMFSAMRLLGKVVPQKLSYDFNYAIFYDERPKTRCIVELLVTRPFCLIIGLDCFLVKYRQTAHAVMHGEIEIHRLMAAIIFLNQVLGVTDLFGTIKDRLYRFVFAGEDGMMTANEKIRQEVWESFVAMTVLQDSKYSMAQKQALMLSWCDDDFQMLILDPKEEKKEKKEEAKEKRRKKTPDNNAKKEDNNEASSA